MKLYYLVLFSVVCAFASAQVKYEREYRLPFAEIPEQAKQLVRDNFPVKKVRWYAEESQDGKSLEAKLCYNSTRYSIEFTQKGILLDIEKQVKFKSLPQEYKLKISDVLSNSFKAYRIKKVQIQYKTIEQLLKANKFNDVMFEVVIKGKHSKSWNLYEVLIDNNGRLIKQLQFKPANTDNLQF